ncbi:hypothetical protein TKK_0002248 [Trichogramma kaykai]
MSSTTHSKYWKVKEEEGKLRLKQFKIAHAKVNWANLQERQAFLDEFILLIEGTWGDNWRRTVPNLKEYFKLEDVEWMILETLKKRKKEKLEYGYQQRINSDPFLSLLQFIKDSNYRVEPKKDPVTGLTVSRRTTVVHHLMKQGHREIIDQVIRMYGWQVNYADETGYTHFHAAIEASPNDVEMFLDHGHDPNLAPPKNPEARTSKGLPLDLPLHLALLCENLVVAEILLRRGANPNLANAAGLTPLLIICRRRKEFWTVGFFDALWRRGVGLADIDARDNDGRTALQWAVASLEPVTVDALINRRAQLTNFVFPTEDYFAHEIRHVKNLDGYEAGVAASVMDVVERLQLRGYEMTREAAWTIMKTFAELGMFKKPAESDENFILESSSFKTKARKMRVSPGVTLDMLMLRRSKPEEVLKLAKLQAYWEFVYSGAFRELTGAERRACGRYLFELICRGFFRHWALGPLQILYQRHKLPLSIWGRWSLKPLFNELKRTRRFGCVQQIIDQLWNRDLFRLCLHAWGGEAQAHEIRYFGAPEPLEQCEQHQREACPAFNVR